MLCIAWSRHCVGSRHGHCNPDGVADIPNGDLKIEDQNTSHGDLPNLRSFLPIFPHENGNNVIEDEVTMSCAVLPKELLRLDTRVAENEKLYRHISNRLGSASLRLPKFGGKMCHY